MERQIHGELNYMAIALCPLRETKLQNEFMRRWMRVAKNPDRAAIAISGMPIDLKRRLREALKYLQIKI